MRQDMHDRSSGHAVRIETDTCACIPTVNSRAQYPGSKPLFASRKRPTRGDEGWGGGGGGVSPSHECLWELCGVAAAVIAADQWEQLKRLWPHLPAQHPSLRVQQVLFGVQLPAGFLRLPAVIFRTPVSTFKQRSRQKLQRLSILENPCQSEMQEGNCNTLVGL